MMTVRYYSLEERFVSFIKLFADAWSGVIAVIEMFASVERYFLVILRLVETACELLCLMACVCFFICVFAGNITGKWLQLYRNAETFRIDFQLLWDYAVNPLMRTLKPLINGQLYSNVVTGTLAVDGWAVTFGTVKRGLGGLSTSYNSMWYYNYQCPLKG